MQSWARSRGARTLAVTNDNVSDLAVSADLHLPLAAGPELAVPATKTYTEGPFVQEKTRLAQHLSARGARVLGTGGPDVFVRACDVHLPTEPSPEWLALFLTILPGQLLAEQFAERLGLDPDVSPGPAKVAQTTLAGRTRAKA